MGQAINRAISRILARLFGPKAVDWLDQNGVPYMGIILLLVFVGFAWAVSHDSRQEVEGQTPEERRRNRRFGRWTAAALFGTGIALLGRSLTFGTFETQKVQEVVWSLVAGALGTTACILFLLWHGKSWTPRARWILRVGLALPLPLGILLAVVGATRLPPPPSLEEVTKAKAVVQEYGGLLFIENPTKRDSPMTLSFHKVTTDWVTDKFGRPQRLTIGLRDENLPLLLVTLRKLTTLKTVDLSNTELTPAGVERVRAAVPNATVTGPTK
jgi:hypothetical protein